MSEVTLPTLFIDDIDDIIDAIHRNSHEDVSIFKEQLATQAQGIMRHLQKYLLSVNRQAEESEKVLVLTILKDLSQLNNGPIAGSKFTWDRVKNIPLHESFQTVQGLSKWGEYISDEKNRDDEDSVKIIGSYFDTIASMIEDREHHEADAIIQRYLMKRQRKLDEALSIDMIVEVLLEHARRDGESCNEAQSECIQEMSEELDSGDERQM